ncbi:hypothetical protein NDU88_002575 [Pleurodeles waltl]|uniref:Uncharacterized protein n=1 Tax=Pleurodeles waltl TaxID=8319 RepID=A0AAV7MS40_PLEWA|nr:hypothetical protein NDU88_002575 [Pleurodeles waltl]
MSIPTPNTTRRNCDSASRSAPKWKYPGDTSASRDAVSEEAEPHWSRSLQDDPEMVGVLNHVVIVSWERQEKEEIKGWRRLEAEKHQMRMIPWGPLEKMLRRKTAVQRALPTKEGEDALRPATFWEERGPFRYEVHPQRDMGRRGF